MMLSKQTRHCAARFALVSSLLAVSSVSWAADSVHVRGVVAAVDEANVTIKTNDGKTIGIILGDNWKIGGIIPATLGDVKQGTFIGTANIEGPNGSKALEVVVFPEAMRGTGEGDYSWDLKPKSSMTNATIDRSVESVDGRTVTLSYKGGQKKVTIPPATPIVTTAAATKDDVKPGAKVFLSGVPSDDGARLTEGFIAVGKNGATPPM